MNAQATLIKADKDMNPKTRQILEGARSAFYEYGFEGTCVDEIVRRAKVSKPTLYNHFADKLALFVAVVQEDCDAQACRIFEVREETCKKDISAGMRLIARHYIDFVTSENALNIFRIVISEARRFPELGKAFYRSGPELSIVRMSQLLELAVSHNLLQVENIPLAAAQFMELCRAEIFYRCAFGVIEQPSEAEKDQVAKSAVEVFLSAYGNKPSP